jgi:hypothetical protein
MNIDKITRFGRSFSIVRIPYSFKLLMQELLTMNVSMRIITEDNIDQLESMSYSKTINKLMFDDTPQTTDVISRVIDSNKARSSVGYMASKTSRKAELDKNQENTNAILLDNQKAQEKMLKDIEILGWRLESRELIEGSEGEQKRYRYVFASLILDERGSPTELWDGPAGGYGQFPNTHPVGWSEKDLLYPNGEKIPDEIMANELARNQTPNNWLSSYINIVQEFQKVMYRKQVIEEAKKRAEQGIEEGAAMMPTSPVYGTLPVGQYQSLGFGAAAAASAAGLAPSPQGSPQYIATSPQYTAMSPQYTASSPQYSSIISPVGSPTVLAGQPANIVFPTNPLQPVIPVAMGVGTQPQPQASQGMLSVEKQQPKEEGTEVAGEGKKTVMVTPFPGKL